MSALFLFLVIFLTPLIGFFGLGFAKGFHHMQYLKILFPEKYSDYHNFWSVFSFKNYNAKLQFLV